MENISLITTALIVAVSKLADPAVEDAYKGLKTLILQKFTGNTKIEVALGEVEKEPEIWKKPLESALKSVHAGDDQEILRTAQILHTTLQQVASKMGGIAQNHYGPGDIINAQTVDKSKHINTGGGDIHVNDI